MGVIRGAFSLFASGAVNAIKFELAPLWLENAKTSAPELVNLLLLLGFAIFHPASIEPLSKRRLFEEACRPSAKKTVRDFVAVFVGRTASRQGQVTCDNP